MDVNRKISQAKAQLLVEYPYFGTIASRLELVCNDDIESFKSNGKTIEYREEYLRSLEAEELLFVFANGAMHTTLAHDMRKSGRSGWLWQMATDMAINDMLVTNGMTLPYGAHYRKRFEGMYAEEIYAELKSDMIREDDNLEYQADDSGDLQESEKEESKPQTKEELQEEILAEQLFGEEAISLLEREFKRGEAPLSIERFFKLSISGLVDWREALKVALDTHFRDDYRLLPPSKKLLYSGIYLPSSFSQTFRLVIVIDSSGSIDEALLNTFLSEVNFLMSLAQNYEIELIVCDDKVQSHKTFFSGDTLEVNLKGYGGTDYRPAFEFVREKFDAVKLLLYFTDLEGIFPKNAPHYEVKWVSEAVSSVPFGEVIFLEE
jgi:predicted metal-dependent peptidase